MAVGGALKCRAPVGLTDAAWQAVQQLAGTHPARRCKPRSVWHMLQRHMGRRNPTEIPVAKMRPSSGQDVTRQMILIWNELRPPSMLIPASEFCNLSLLQNSDLFVPRNNLKLPKYLPA